MNKPPSVIKYDINQYSPLSMCYIRTKSVKYLFSQIKNINKLNKNREQQKSEAKTWKSE